MGHLKRGITITTSAVTAAAMMTAVAGCMSSGGPTRVDAVKSAVAATTSGRTAEIDITISAGGSGGSTVRIIYDFQRKVGALLPIPAGDQQPVIFAGDSAYLPLAPYVEGFTGGLLATGQTTPPAAPELPAGKKWLVNTLESPNAKTAAFDRLIYPYLGDGDATGLLRSLTRITQSVHQSGVVSIDGVRAKLYELYFDNNALRSVVSTSNASEIVDNPAQLWVDSLGRIRQLRFSYSVGGPPEITETVDYTRFGIPVTVTVPPQSQTMSLTQAVKILCAGAQQVYANGCSS